MKIRGEGVRAIAEHLREEEQTARRYLGMYGLEVLGLSDEETLQVIRNRRGEGLLCAGHNRISVAFQPTRKEYDMITTSRDDLEAQMQKMTPPDNDRVAVVIYADGCS